MIYESAHDLNSESLDDIAIGTEVWAFWFERFGGRSGRILREEILSRMIDSNAENFMLFGVKNKSTGKLVSDITNPRHKYWESEKRAQSAINGYNPIYVTQRDRKKHNKEDLEVVEIKCVVQEK
jgi:hypothetical protein